MSSDTTSGSTCRLCDLPLSRNRVENDAEEAFCCQGCLKVNNALDDVPEVDEAEMRATGADAESAGTVDDDPPEGHDRSFLKLSGMHCPTCERFLESVATSTDGVDTAEASYVTETVRLDYDPDVVTEDNLIDRLSTAGYSAYRRDDAVAAHHAEDTALWRLAAGTMLGMMVMIPYLIYIYPVHFGLLPPWLLELARAQLESARYFYWVLLFFTSLVLFVVGRPILRGAYVSLRARSPNMDLLVALAAVSAYLYSTLAVLLGRIDIYYDVTVAIVVVVTAGNYYESSIKRKATDLLTELNTAQVDEALRYHGDGSTTEVGVEELEPGERILVREGDRIPVDGTVRDGQGTVDEAVVTGESLPVAKHSGDEVVGGSILTEGSVVVEVGRDATSSVDRITDLMWNLQSSNHGIQKLADKLAVIFVPGVVTLAFVAGVAYLLLGSTPTGALLVALTVLLVSCPCALGLATPLAVASGIREALERGIVVFDDTVFERLREVDLVVFDKTGTLTTGRLEVVESTGSDDLLRAAAVLERQSSHPIAEAIVDRFGVAQGSDQPVGANGGGQGLRSDGGAVDASSAGQADTTRDTPRLSEFESHARGVEGIVDGTRVLVGHPDVFKEQGWSVPEAVAGRASAAREDGDLPILVGQSGTAEGTIVLRDEPRENWEATVSALRERGMDVMVLTGDDERAATAFRDHPAVTQVFAGVPPEGKAETIRRLGTGRRVAMVGDGTNDGPALASADLGVALGSGTALAVDAADVAIVDDDIASLETVFDLSVAAGSRVRQNIGWAFLYNAVAIPLALSSLLNPLFAAVAMASSSLLVVGNSTRALIDESD